MSVLIKCMEMPKNCNHCFVTPGCCPAIRKRIKSDTPGYTWIPANYRHEDCPLVPVQEPHGRMIDANALCKTLHSLAENEYTPEVFANWIENHIDTIIPASYEAE